MHALIQVLRLDASGKSKSYFARRRDLLREYNLQPRDLRRIDPTIDFSKTSPSITVKENVLLINLGGTRCGRHSAIRGWGGASLASPMSPTPCCIMPYHHMCHMTWYALPPHVPDDMVCPTTTCATSHGMPYHHMCQMTWHALPPHVPHDMACPTTTCATRHGMPYHHMLMLRLATICTCTPCDHVHRHGIVKMDSCLVVPWGRAMLQGYCHLHQCPTA